MTDYEMKNFEETLWKSVYDATQREENTLDGLTKDGGISWSFVDADAYMEMHLKYPKMEKFDEVYYSLFDKICDNVERYLAQPIQC